MEFARRRNLYHKEPLPCDLSDGITMSQLPKTISDLFRISHFYLDQAVGDLN